MNSCLYECRVMHHRLAPKVHRFVYGLFMFYLDLDELDELPRRLTLVSRNRFNVFDFRDRDHMRFGSESVKDNMLRYLERNGVRLNGGKIFLLTHLRVFGYVFNPVSFYFCFDAQGVPVCAVAEVSNTFREMKPFLLGPGDRAADGAFKKSAPKHFYVSPFMDLEARFEFRLDPPGGQLRLSIDDSEGGARVLLSSLTGLRKPLTNAALAWSLFRYPLVTLRVIFLIHWNALLLLWKGVPYFRKADRPALQRDLLNPHQSPGHSYKGGPVQ